MNNLDDQIRQLINESIDAELGPRPPAPPFHPALKQSPAQRWTPSRSMVSLTAAACVALVVAGTVLATQLSSSDHSVTPGDPTTVTTPAPPTSAPSVAPTTQTVPTTPASANTVVACAASQLALSVTKGSTQSGDGRWLVLGYRNTAAATCTLTGYPRADVLNAAGASVEQIPQWDGIGGLPNWPRKATTITLSPDGKASALIEWSAAADESGDGCSTNADIGVALPGSTDSQRLGANTSLGFPIRMCGEAVTALVAGTPGTT